MKYLNYKLLTTAAFLTAMTLIFSFCTNEVNTENFNETKPIKQSEIIGFQKAYGVSFNAISAAIENNSYYETKAKEHINKNYNFDEGKVMFKVGHDNTNPYRYTYEGILSYLIGKSDQFPEDIGIAKENWRKMEWKNDGIINDVNGIAIVMGKVKSIKENNDFMTENFTMCLKRNSKGELKLISHKIAEPCE